MRESAASLVDRHPAPEQLAPSRGDQAAVSVEPLINEFSFRDRLHVLGNQIENDYRDKPLTIVAVLTGSLIALADLVRQIRIPLRIALVQASSYHGATTTATTLVMNEAFAPDVTGRDVLLLDDILDTGQTLMLLPSISRTAVPPRYAQPSCFARLVVKLCPSCPTTVGLPSLMPL